jgi:hypothetical protein
MHAKLVSSPGLGPFFFDWIQICSHFYFQPPCLRNKRSCISNFQSKNCFQRAPIILEVCYVSAHHFNISICVQSSILPTWVVDDWAVWRCALHSPNLDGPSRSTRVANGARKCDALTLRKMVALRHIFEMLCPLSFDTFDWIIKKAFFYL